MKKKYTILFIPPDLAPVKKYDFSLSKKGAIRVVFFAVLVFFGALVIHDLYQFMYIRQHNEEYAQVKELQNTLQSKEDEITHLNQSASKMTEDLNKISALEEKVAEVLKLQPPNSSVQSRGSVQAVPQSFSPSQGVDQSSELVSGHLELFQNYYEAALQLRTKLDHTPSILPVQGEIASRFGYRKNPFGGWSKEFHDGVDFACDYGTPVVATADGVVTFSGWDGVYGRKVELDHGNGIVTFYGHNSKLSVEVGQKVKKGEIIAYSGNTGRSTGAHLHYGAYVNGVSTDPLQFTNFTEEQ